MDIIWTSQYLLLVKDIQKRTDWRPRLHANQRIGPGRRLLHAKLHQNWVSMPNTCTTPGAPWKASVPSQREDTDDAATDRKNAAACAHTCRWHSSWALPSAKASLPRKPCTKTCCRNSWTGLSKNLGVCVSWFFTNKIKKHTIRGFDTLGWRSEFPVSRVVCNKRLRIEKWIFHLRYEAGPIGNHAPRHGHGLWEKEYSSQTNL